MKYCKLCLLPDTKPQLVFDENGVCSACITNKLKQNVDWFSKRKDFIKLIEAQESDVIPKELSISGFSDLLEKDGSPEIQASIKFIWNKGPWGLGFFGKHIGEFYETRNRLSDGRLWKVKAYNTINGHVDYHFNFNSSNSRVRFGINNMTDERAPLASDIFGYYFDKHDNLGRYYYIDLSYKF